ncbi:L,D-transpeptidase family protein [Kineobactrum salinum]|uniref:L,D-transpeptidase family protein n=1 Tax=Kineobactrum salinum TaxID=2708301 RepID=A0A6C0U893_9GAMM|nr:L,D-transpeptidase family protein [Kineobactrum salinum]QIB67257.1 L,D-transpeptidase family protein [Kineobactrum salinum]
MKSSVFRQFCTLFLFFSLLQPVLALPQADQVLVVKSERTLYLKREGKSLRAYRIALGPVPWGHKRQAGDERTPEGHYVLDFKNPDSRYYKSIRISYPNLQDRFRAQSLGVSPGGNIMIHGQPPDAEWPPEVAQLFNWTDGCIAVSNEDMDEIWQAVSVGTPIEIRP